MSDTYDDIINKKAPKHPIHPQMSMWERAAQFAPFAALNGFEDAIDETAKCVEAADDPSICSDPH